MKVIKSIKACVAEQFLHLRCRMTGHVEGKPYRFLTDRSESKKKHFP